MSTEQYFALMSEIVSELRMIRLRLNAISIILICILSSLLSFATGLVLGLL